MNNLLAVPHPLPALTTQDLLRIRTNPQFNNWLWDDSEQEFKRVEFDTRAYTVINTGQETEYIVHIWRSPSTGQLLACCECPASKICKHIVAVLTTQVNYD